MYKLSFYETNIIPVAKALPKLLEKIIEKGQRVLIYTDSQENMEFLDRQLWVYSRNFLPHATCKDDFIGEQPILISDELENLNDAKILVIYGQNYPQNLSGFDHVIKMFDGNGVEGAKAANQAFNKLKKESKEAIYWMQNDKGAWAKSA